ncbi:hypothetical protein L3556_14135 [Candidatus Synechococcus calcipolaris G9]|uniref:Chromosome partition protein Smc n=1 Tax=Candidatus Synechococcus calcipolaris G9 TaxID=1497997 RepID=A0ABT6F2M1_9SYNE|nr:hypothetical protein [Candidatus Synechococcus calcipolaris]MDG2992060.1 hypothetical protein [Candidatus Synechococcus calcipolaris G9]
MTKPQPSPPVSMEQLTFPWLVADSPSSDPVNAPLGDQYQPLPTNISPQDHDQSQDYSHKRILHLEQALDQCQSYIQELKQQLSEQRFLEEILAQTEETSHIQQQAILTLKQQLEQQQSCQQELSETAAVRESLENILVTAQAEIQNLHQEIDDLTQAQEALEKKLVDSHIHGRQYQHELELVQSQLRQSHDQNSLYQSQIHQLESQLEERQHTLNDLEVRLQRSNGMILTHQDMINALQEAQGSESNKNKVIQGLSKTLLNTQNKLREIDTNYANQHLQQAKLQHYAQEIEDRSSQQQVRIQTLERQVAEMQEQILHQAQLAREQETAVQHWKDRYYASEQMIDQLRCVVAKLLGDIPDHPSISIDNELPQSSGIPIPPC